jgi:hypothetical protein
VGIRAQLEKYLPALNWAHIGDTELAIIELSVISRMASFAF